MTEKSRSERREEMKVHRKYDMPKTVPTSKTMGRTDQITAAKLDALYRAVMEMRGGHDAELEKAFKGDAETSDE